LALHRLNLHHDVPIALNPVEDSLEKQSDISTAEQDESFTPIVAEEITGAMFRVKCIFFTRPALADEPISNTFVLPEAQHIALTFPLESKVKSGIYEHPTRLFASVLNVTAEEV
jgi:hypothetical protein